MQSHVVKVMVPKKLRPQYRKVILHVFTWEIMANMTQVSDVAHGPLNAWLITTHTHIHIHTHTHTHTHQYVMSMGIWEYKYGL
jgi:hypothetical protein